jgi:xanthine dehydrogenase accessory factor
MLSLIKKLAEILDRREPVVQCTVIDTKGSTPLKSGARMLVLADGTIYGTIGGGNVEKLVISDALESLQLNKPDIKEYNLLQNEMCCGGVMKIFLEPMQRSKQLLIFGAGHVGSAIAEFAQTLNFKTVLLDERIDILNRVNVPSTHKIQLHHTEAFEVLNFDTDTYIVICTHLHEYDREILAYCLNQPCAYLGMIGSKRKVLVTRKRFLLQEISTREQLDKVDMPMGFDIGQNSPAEIALGIIAKIIAVSNGKEILTPFKINEYDEAGFNSDGCS